MNIGGRYSLGRKSAPLRIGALYEAQDDQSGQPVTIHVAPADRPHNLRQVSQRLAALRHRNLPRIRELIEQDAQLFTINDEFRGTPLSQLAVPLSAELTRRYLRQVLSALNYLHTQEPPVIHRDLRPDTVLVAAHGTVQLIGLDVARVATDGAAAGPSDGDPHYAAPEQQRGEPGTAGNDLYSAGAVAFFMATGQNPPPALERAARPDAPLALPSDLPADLKQLIEKLLATSPAERLASAAAAAAVLGQQEHRIPSLLMPTDSAVDPAAGVLAEGLQRPAAAPDEESEPRSSMWGLLFGRKKKNSEPMAIPDDSSQQVTDLRDSFPFADLTQLDLDLEVAQILSETAARSIQGVCIAKVGPRELLVAVKDPSLVYIYDNVDVSTQGRYRAILQRADAVWVDRAMEWAYRNRSQADWRTWVQRRAMDQVTLTVNNPMADTALLGEKIPHPIVEATDRMLKEALSVGTSDIHLEAYENRSEVRYRIDGVLQPVISFTPEQGSAVVKRIKVMANMDIAQERVPQGGRISLALGDRRYDLRVSIVPVGAGESVVMRVLKKGSFDLTLADLGLDAEVEKKFRSALNHPHGLILVCGPTGSGKSTTLYASLKELHRPDRKLLTVEDPVEYDMDGLIQVQVNMAPRDEEQKVTFAKVLREFLRHDPEVILVGEIRDPETAHIALQASLTGHLVLSTVHTNDSVGIVSRLRDMGCKSFLVASTLRCGLAQRLARRLCTSCRQQSPVPAIVQEEMQRESVELPSAIYTARGCRECLGTGYRGRVGLYEVLEIDPTLRTLITKEVSDQELLEHLRSEGFRTLYQNGLEKVASGLVSFEEVQRVCQSG